jgi:1,4-dihydroxy-2-naphthoate octaprenyltransferase
VRRPSLVAVAVASFVVGAALLLAFEQTLTLAAGVLLLVASVVCGVFAIATPEYLGRAPDEDAAP